MPIRLRHGVPSAPMPGQSWTDPVGKYPHQQPPQHTDPHEAAMELWNRFMQPKHFVQIVALLKSGTPVTTLTLSILMNSVLAGTFSIDIAMLLRNVVASMLQSIATKAKIKYRFHVDNAMPGQAQLENIMGNTNKLNHSMRMPSMQPDLPQPSGSQDETAGLMSPPQGMNNG